MSFGGQALPGPAEEPKRSPESLAVDGRRYENKGRREGRREGCKKKKGKGSCAPMMFFISISSVRSLSPQFE